MHVWWLCYCYIASPISKYSNKTLWEIDSINILWYQDYHLLNEELSSLNGAVNYTKIHPVKTKANLCLYSMVSKCLFWDKMCCLLDLVAVWGYMIVLYFFNSNLFVAQWRMVWYHNIMFLSFSISLEMMIIRSLTFHYVSLCIGRVYTS